MQVKLKKKCCFRRLIKVITSEKDIYFRKSFNTAANKKHKRSPKNQNRKKMTKTGYFSRHSYAFATLGPNLART